MDSLLSSRVEKRLAELGGVRLIHEFCAAVNKSDVLLRQKGSQFADVFYSGPIVSSKDMFEMFGVNVPRPTAPPPIIKTC